MRMSISSHSPEVLKQLVNELRKAKIWRRKHCGQWIVRDKDLDAVRAVMAETGISPYSISFFNIPRGGTRPGAGRPPIRGEPATCQRSIKFTEAELKEIVARVPRGTSVNTWIAEAAIQVARQLTGRRTQ